MADLVDNMIDSPQMVDSIRRFKAVAGGAEMLEQRYPPLQPEFFRPCPIDSEAQWLTQRVATTHDIHHVVAGFGTMPAGESGVLAITAAQIGFPAYVLLTTAGHGMVIGHQAQYLVAARWEEGWERPISDPADGEAYGLAVKR